MYYFGTAVWHGYVMTQSFRMNVDEKEADINHTETTALPAFTILSSQKQMPTEIIQVSKRQMKK